MNFQEIKAILNEEFKGDSHKLDDLIYKKSSSHPKVGNIELVDDYGGEGEGESYYKVVKFVDHNVYGKLEGAYYSYDGIHFYDIEDDFTEVKPVEKVVTHYDPV